ncbi:MAG: sugar phosphate isomerase/epimerase [Candidatus Omnitrophica bacterium]|nr:sugar phosphate isomerase/epimerase [Candidatus Omnitrophota bacterium]
MENSNPIAISTAWNYDLKANVKDTLSQIRKLGFNAIEIGYNFTPEKLDKLISFAKDMDIKVVSIHNFCPMPNESMPGRHLSNCFRVSSLDKKERMKAVDYTKRTIDTACRVSCNALVFHAGTIELEEKDVSVLLQMYREGKSDSKEYDSLKERLLKSRKAKKYPYLDAVIKSLEEITLFANSANIKIGLETRYYPHEIPDLDEIENLLNIFGDKGLVYWHDVGHAEANDKLGITSHENFLARFKDYMFGIHIHGIKGIDDHLAPFTGDFDFSKVKPYLRDNLIKVIEAHLPATPEELIKAKELLKDV